MWMPRADHHSALHTGWRLSKRCLGLQSGNLGLQSLNHAPTSAGDEAHQPHSRAEPAVGLYPGGKGLMMTPPWLRSPFPALQQPLPTIHPHLQYSGHNLLTAADLVAQPPHPRIAEKMVDLIGQGVSVPQFEQQLAGSADALVDRVCGKKETFEVNRW